MNKPDKLTIMHIISSSNIGGSPKHTLILCEELKKLGCKPILVFPPGGSFEKSFIGSGIQCEPVILKNGWSPALYIKLLSIIEKENVSIIHTHELRSDWIGYKLGIKSHLPMVTTIHNMITKSRINPLKLKFYNHLSRKIYNSIAMTLAVSEAVKTNMVNELGVIESKVRVIQNGTKTVDVSSLKAPAEIRKQWNIPEKSPLLVIMGRLIPIQKGHTVMIHAMKEIRENSPETRLLIVGDGSIREQLEELSKELKVDPNVIFTGWQENTNDILNACDICIVPSLWDPLPRTVLEAMMLGKPVIGSNVDGIQEAVVDGETGLLVQPNDSDSLSKAIVRLLDDKTIRMRMGEKGKSRANQLFTSERHARMTLEVYKTCIQKTQ